MNTYLQVRIVSIVTDLFIALLSNCSVNKPQKRDCFPRDPRQRPLLRNAEVNTSLQQLVDKQQ
jgi:hypothetical protein